MRRRLDRPGPETARGRLTARPGREPAKALAAGLHTLAVPGSRDALLYIPRAVDATAKVPLIVSLHGAGGNAPNGIHILQAQADQYDFAVLAPASHRATWDFIAGGYGPDVAALDHSLSETFRSLNVRPESTAISGFSDGASYALSIGIANGDLFHDILAFSPGFLSPPSEQGRPRVFISHGNRDAVLPIRDCSRVIVPKLRKAGYDVTYREFNGPHTAPADIKEEAMRWWLRR